MVPDHLFQNEEVSLVHHGEVQDDVMVLFVDGILLYVVEVHAGIHQLMGGTLVRKTEMVVSIPLYKALNLGIDMVRVHHIGCID